MENETATIAPTEAPVATTPAGYGTPEQAEPAQPISGEPDAPEPEERPEETFETWMAQTEADDFKWKDDWKRHTEETHSKGWQAAQEYMEPRLEQVRQAQEAGQTLYKQANEGFRLLHSRLQKLVEDGNVDEDALDRVLRSNDTAWKALESIGKQAQEAVLDRTAPQLKALGGIEAADYIFRRAAEITGQATLHAKFAPRNEAVKAGKEDPAKVIEDFIRAVMEVGVKQGKAATAEAVKAQAREKAGPGTGAGTAAGGRPTPAQYAAATSEQRREWREKGIDPQ